jgi:hypothetical protein
MVYTRFLIIIIIIIINGGDNVNLISHIYSVNSHTVFPYINVSCVSVGRYPRCAVM